MSDQLNPNRFKIGREIFDTTQEFYDYAVKIRAIASGISKSGVDTALFTWVLQYGITDAVTRTDDNADRIRTLWGKWYSGKEVLPYLLMRRDSNAPNGKFEISDTGRKYFNLLCSEREEGYV